MNDQLSRRDQLAVQILNGLFSGCSIKVTDELTTFDHRIVKNSIDLADLLIEKLDEGKNERKIF